MDLIVSWILGAPIYLACAWIVSSEAHTIGRRRVPWFAFSFFLLPIAIITLIPLSFRAGRARGGQLII